MRHPIGARAKALSWLLMLVYFGSYMMRINFAVMIVKVCSDMQLEKSALAIVITGLTVAYGVGLIVSGFIGDKIPSEVMILVGLATAAVCNVLMFFCQTVPMMTLVWTVNGFAHSMLWPPIVRLISAQLNDVEYNYAVVRIAWGSSFATILLYLVCPLLLRVMGWRTVLLVCAAVGVGILILWVLASKRLLLPQNAKQESAHSDESASSAVPTIPLPRYVFVPLVLIMLGIVFQGMLRDGVTNWVPSLLSESFGIAEEDAIFAAVIPAIFSMISFYAFDLLHRRLIKNEVLCGSVIFGGSVACAAILYVVNCFLSSAILSVLLVALIIACMHGVNLMLISVLPKRFAKSGKVATFSGLLNSCTYIGAAIATPVFASIAERNGWGVTILSWLAVSVLGLAVCLGAVPLWRRFKRDYSDS